VAVKFQYNKVSMQAIQKELKIRLSALPTLKSKEAYLRLRIKDEKHRLDRLAQAAEELRASVGPSERLFAEFPPSSLNVVSVHHGEENVAGISIPVLGEIRIDESTTAAALEPGWLPWGRRTVVALLRSIAELDVARERIRRLEYARKKTTQKVNLYEKVQIPEFSDAVRKIKRYLEDVENLEKAAQKITKARQARRGEAA